MNKKLMGSKLIAEDTYEINGEKFRVTVIERGDGVYVVSEEGPWSIASTHDDYAEAIERWHEILDNYS